MVHLAAGFVRTHFPRLYYYVSWTNREIAVIMTECIFELIPKGSQEVQVFTLQLALFTVVMPVC